MSEVPQDEVEDFNAACEAYGVDPQRFTLKAIENFPAVGVGPLDRRIEVRWEKSNGEIESEPFEAGNGTNWVVTFVGRLQAGAIDLS